MVRKLPPITRFRISLGLLIFGLVVSGVTAFPLLHEMRLVTQLLGLGDATSAAGQQGMAWWILTVRFGLEEIYATHPWIAYGTDWLAFAHLAIALFFIGPIIRPLHSRDTLIAGVAACIGVIPLALICGEIRGIPLASRIIDCGFGIIALGLLSYCVGLLPRIQADAAAHPRRPPAKVAQLIADIIAVLSEPVTDEEAAQGWDTELKAKWRRWYIDLDHRFKTGGNTSAALGAARAMDFDGVGRTPLSSRAAAIGVLIEESGSR